MTRRYRPAVVSIICLAVVLTGCGAGAERVTGPTKNALVQSNALRAKTTESSSVSGKVPAPTGAPALTNRLGSNIPQAIPAPDESPGEIFLLPPDILSEIIDHARTGYPEEVCGIIAGVGGEGLAIHRGRNQSPTPHVAFELDAETVARQIEFEDQGLTLAAIYHSHPYGPEIPSTTDASQAYYPNSIHLICSLADFARPVVRGFRIQNGLVREVKLVSQG